MLVQADVILAEESLARVMNAIGAARAILPSPATIVDAQPQVEISAKHTVL